MLLIIDCLNWYEKLSVEKAYKMVGDISGIDFLNTKETG